MIREHFDIIVVGAGHAGIEAAYAGVRLGKKVLLVTTNLKRIGYMSCNPSIGGLGKGHMVREIDILGGLMGQAADATCIQFKRLNSSKGPAVRGTRMQSDKDLYVQFVTQFLKSLPNLSLMEGEVKSLIIDNDICRGVRLHDGSEILSKAVIITTGTFLNAVMHTGLKQVPGGRVGDQASQGLSDQLKAYGFEVKRLKTGTPARLDRDSIRWEILEPQWGDPHFYPFSLKSPRVPQLPQIACYISRTNPQTHDIIRSNLHLSPMYAGIIEGVGPRYCPSIEDKIVRFADRDSHQTFLEPEGLNTNSIYLQGISTSLPEDIQLQFLKTIPGLENVRVLRFGYAVEYDFVLPTQIYHRLETRAIKRLFLAGQINGTSGYEEAAVQGLLAGINACHVLDDKPEIVLGRHEAYAGVLIDDLVTKGTQEPYRMLTSRAEYRLVLREDNVVDRLGSLSLKWGLASGELLERIESLKSDRAKVLERLRNTRLTPVSQVQELLLKKGTSVLKKDISFEDLLRRPELTCFDLEDLGFVWNTTHEVAEAVEIEVKYQGYIKRQQELIDQSKRFENKLIPEGLDFSMIKGLSTEEVEKLSRVRPRTLGQASRISGVSPSAIQCLMIYLKNQEQIGGASLVP